jgi:uncharacterized surface anchored protein
MMFRLLSGLLSFLVLMLATPGLVAAQATETVIYIWTVALDGTAMTDACYTFVNASLEGCDENQDGYIRFEGIPAGTYTVVQTQAVPGYLPSGDFPVTIEPTSIDQYADVLMAPSNGNEAATVDISIRAVDPANGASVPGACVILHGGSIEGCDENADGQITFADVAAGTYLLEETATPAGSYHVAPQWVVVDRPGEILVMRPMSGALPGAGTANVSLITRDPANGNLVPGACYIIVNASNEGCDENGDGQVDFQGVAVGAFTVQQTVTPGGYPKANDFPINIDPLEMEQSIVVKQAPEQHDASHRHVSIVLYDTNNGQPVIGDACLEIVGASLEGCDDNLDGQIDFLDVAVGTHPVVFTRVPDGYSPAYVTNSIANSADNPFPVTVVYIGLTPER